MRWEGEGKGGGADRASVESEFMRGMRSEREPGEKKEKGRGGWCGCTSQWMSLRQRRIRVRTFSNSSALHQLH